MVVGVGFCKIKVDSNFLLVLKIKCTKFHQTDIQFYIYTRRFRVISFITVERYQYED
jgi:hypothetical protein